MSAPTSLPLTSVNRQFQLAAIPSGLPTETDFKLLEAPMPSPADGQVLLKTLYWSVDPYMRGRITGVRSYADPVHVGDLMVGGTVGKVLESKGDKLKAGALVVGYWGWQEFAAVKEKELQALDPRLEPVSAALGVLGMPGMTAYFGLLDICQPKAGETVVVSGAAGAVGSYVGQIAKIKGCRVIGTAGADDKVDCLLHEFGFDAAFNYKTTQDYSDKLKELCPQGIDCYFDNVGGAITDAVFPLLNVYARVAICGQISQYNLQKPEPGPRLLTSILVKQARVEGFIVMRFMNRFPEAFGQMSAWLKEGKIKYREQRMEGFENIPQAFIAMLCGANTGKMVVAAH